MYEAISWRWEMCEQARFAGVSGAGVSIPSKVDDRTVSDGGMLTAEVVRGRAGQIYSRSKTSGEMTLDRRERRLRLTLRCSEKPDTPPIEASA